MVLCGRRPFKGLLIARPYSRRLALGRRSTKRMSGSGVGSGGATRPRLSSCSTVTVWPGTGFLNPHSWEIGMVFDLEILATGETRW
jgi:hypothetical protein